jgi:uncharacterized protein (TIGR02266 family)
MAQETRKDPRAKVLTMTVRYKSATLDEFIEHHSHDVSRGGMFIKTPSPFPPGTLLKFEVKIAEDQRLMQGVGRVVWKREPPDAGGDDRPAGMGVKFIKIDDDSRAVIDQLVARREGELGAYEAGQEAGGGSASLPPVSVPAPAAKASGAAPPKAAPSPRKATMIGLGALSGDDAGSSPPPADSGAGGGFFPKTDSEADMPPPEDRTVMKQAAELLQDALREAGGSMDEVREAPGDAKPTPAAGQPPEARPAAADAAPRQAASPPAQPAQARSSDAKAEPEGAAAARPGSTSPKTARQ